MLLLIACTSTSSPSDSGPVTGPDSAADSAPDTGCADPVMAWPDLDGDGFGAGTALERCDLTGHAENGDDCDDADADAYPGAPEVCDGKWTDCSVAWNEDALVTFTPEGGAAVDMTADFAGSPGAPGEPYLTESGTVDLCASTYHFDLTTTAPGLTLRGQGSGVTTLDGGGSDRMLYIKVSDATVRVEGLTMTNGWGCYGTAISVWQANSCSDSGASSGGGYSNIDLTLDDVVISNTENKWGNGVVSINTGRLTLIDSVMQDNIGDAIWAEASDVVCQDSAVVGNTGNGIEVEVKQFETSYEVSADNCDFGVGDIEEGGTDNGGTDVLIDHWPSGSDFRGEFDDGVSFTCDTTVATCE